MPMSHVVADVTSTGRRRRGASPRAGSATGRRAARVGPARRAYPMGPTRFVTGVAVIVALATAAFGIQAYVRAGHEQTRIIALQADLTQLQRRVADDEHGAAAVRRHVRSVAAQASGDRRALARLRWALQSVPSQAQVAGVRDEFAAYAACIPQLQSEIAGLGISWKINPAKSSIDFFKLSTRAPISSSCASALTGR
jgi:hypothetical protein